MGTADGLRIATRGSPLALWQARRVARMLEDAGAVGGPAQLVVVETNADRRLDIPIHEMGGKGVFAKEVQAAVLDGRADLAVHSAKDLPSLTPDGLVLAAFPERASPLDVLVGARLAQLPHGATVATGSVRRRSQLAAHRPDLVFVELRGNIGTRLTRLRDDPGVDAIVMARAALDRLDSDETATLLPVVEDLPVSVALPQVGQGALAVECRSEDHATSEALAAIDDAAVRTVVEAERAFLETLGGDCSLPAAAHARLDDGSGTIVIVDAMVASVDGTTVLRRSRSGPDGVGLGHRLARELLASGGDTLLDQARR